MIAQELYPHHNDTGKSFDDWENSNEVGDPSYATLIEQLSKTLRAAVHDD